MGYLRENHPGELHEILMVLDILADCGVRESREGYYILPDEEDEVASMPRLQVVVGMLEKLLISLTDGAYENYIRQHQQEGRLPENLMVQNFIEDRYSMEMQSIFNQILDLHQGKYYEAEKARLAELGMYRAPRGIPKIETIGKRVHDQVTDLLYKIEENNPGYSEQIRAHMDL